MSHSAQMGEFFIIHNGDFSGEVQITVRDEKRDNGTYTHKQVASLPMWLLEAIVAKKVRNERIAAIEEAGPDELFGLKKNGAVMD